MRVGAGVREVRCAGEKPRWLMLVAALAVASPGYSQSPPVTADYSVTVSEQFTDSHAFSGQSTFITSVNPTVVVRRDSEASKISLLGSVTSVNYSNSRAAKDAVNFLLGFDGVFTRDLNTFRLDADLLRDSRFTSTPGSPDFQLARVQRTQFTINPSFIRSLTERFSVNVGAGYTSSAFDENLNGALFDFTNERVSGGFQYRLSEVDTIGGTVSASRYRTDPESTSSDSTSFQGTWERRWTERLDTTVALGQTQTKTRTRRNTVICSSPNIIDCLLQIAPFVTVPVGTESDTSTPTWNLTSRYRFAERSTLLASYGKDILPSAGGAVTTRELYAVSANHQFGERLSGSASYQRTESAFTGLPGVSAGTSTFESISLRMSYNLASDWTVDGALTRSESTLPTGARVSHVAFVSLRKDWRNNRIWP